MSNGKEYNKNTTSEYLTYTGSGGHFIGKTYYSESLPKGQGDDIEYNEELYNLAEKVIKQVDNVATEEDVDLLQQMLVDINYLDADDPTHNDGFRGTMTDGAAYRYIYNYNDEAFWHNVNSSIKWFFGY